MSTAGHWLAANWPAPPGIVAGCTLRTGGCSEGQFASLNLGQHVGDHVQRVVRNRMTFREICRLPAEPVWLNQVHGTNVVFDDAKDSVPDADGRVSRDVDTVCVALTADCLPVVLASRDGREVGIAHAGWRGLSAGVVEQTIAGFDANSADILSWLGPAISQSAFEVGDEVRHAFVERASGAANCFVANENGRWQADLYALARMRLAAAGVDAVYGGEFCTLADADRFFSYRREGECGRMASFIFRRNE